MAAARYIQRENGRDSEGEAIFKRDIIHGDRIQKSTSASSTPNEFPSQFLNSRPPTKPQRGDQRQEQRDACNCCPYGYHIDLDFVQYAAEEAKSGVQQQHDSLKLLKKPKTKTSKSMEQYDEEEEEKSGQTNRKSVYENVPALASAKRVDNLADRGGKTIKTTGLSGGPKLENQCLFSDSLENVMSDFEETLSRGGAKKNKDYSSDYEMSKASSLGKKRTGTAAAALDAFQRSPALKAGAGRTDGYTSDCGYAVPTGAANRPTTLRFASKPTTFGENNHYYASPNTLTTTISSKTPPVVEYATANATARRPPATSALSDSMSSLSSASSTQNANGGISTTAPLPLNTEPSNSFGYESSRFSNGSRPSLDNSLNYSRTTPISSELLSPRLLASSPLPPKPSLGLSGRVGAQIEQLASHLNSTHSNSSMDYGSGRESARLYDDGRSHVSPTRRISELQERIRSIPGPAFGGEKRRLQDELNRLVNEGKRTGYYRSITPTVLDTSGGGYATALAKAMSSISERQQQQQHLPEPPPRRESVTRMQSGTTLPSTTVTPSSPAYTIPPRIRTNSANGLGSGNGSLNLDTFHSYRRTNPLSNSSSSSNATTSTIVRPIGRSSSAGARDDGGDYVSDSEYALGDRSMERFAALRRSRHLLARPQSALPPAASESQQQPKSGLTDHHHQLINAWRKEVEEKTRNGDLVEPAEKRAREINGGETPDVISNSIHAKLKPLMRTIGVVTDIAKPIQKVNASTCTPPLPQPKPCTECDGLRQRILELSVKPFTFTRGTGTDECTCEPCLRRSRLKFASIACGTSIQDTLEYRREKATTADIELPCEECEQRNGIIHVSFGVNTVQHGLFGTGVETGANTDFVEVRNRHVNTDQKNFRSLETNTEHLATKHAGSMVDKAVLLSNGGYRTITSNTTPPLMVTFGVNTDDRNWKQAEPALDSSLNIPDDIKLRQTVESVAVRSVETREIETSTDEAFFENQKKETVENKEVAKKSVAVGTNFASNVTRMVDKYVDSTVRTRDVGTRTPPPPPPPLQPLRSSSCQTINQIKTMISIGSGDCTLSLSECDLCKGTAGMRVGSKSADELEFSGFEVGTQTESTRIDRLPSFEGASTVSTASGPDERSSDRTDSNTNQAKASDLPPPSQQRRSNWDTSSEDQSVSGSSQYDRQDSDSKSDLVQKEQFASSAESTNVSQLQSSLEKDSKPEPKVQRGIQRIFSPKLEKPELDAAMWTSQTSAISDASSDRGAELTEESTVVCPLDDDEEKLDEVEEEIGEKSSPKLNIKKIDFKKPRQTRAFELSKAAAAKKLLTSDTAQGQLQMQRQGTSSVAANGKHHQQSTAAFHRSSIQSRSVRLDSKKGDSLAYITEKKQFQHGQGTSQAAVGKVAKRAVAPQTPPSTGLKGKVVIKKSPAVRKVTPAPGCQRLATPNRFKSRPLPYQRRTSSLPGTDTASSSLTTSLKDEEAAAEAEDIVGPLPSEVAAAAARARWSASEEACYTNLAVDSGEEEYDENGSQSAMDTTKKKLVGNVVENLPTKVERNGDRNDDGSSDESDSSERGDEDTEESMDEGSYDTNGNISSTCDVTAENSAIGEDSKNGERVGDTKFEMSPQLRDACNTLNLFLATGKSPSGDEQLEWAQKFLQHEWLKTSASKRANPAHVGDFLDLLEDFSPQLLRQVVNFCDQNENTALHYAVSRGHFDIVSLLLDTKTCNLNKANKAGYTPVMLASLCPISSDTDSMVIQRLFQMGDVNIKASQHGQTALMLAVSHGNLDTTKLLLEAGAGVNIQDEEGSTALMCAAEHGHKEIVRLLLSHPEIDASMTDNDKSTALSIAVDNDHKDIGILIYAHLNYGRPPPSFQSKSAPVWC